MDAEDNFAGSTNFRMDFDLRCFLSFFSDENTNIYSVIVSMTSKSSDEITSTDRSELRVTGWARKR